MTEPPLLTDWRIICHSDGNNGVMVGVVHGEHFAQWIVTDTIVRIDKRYVTTESTKFELGLALPDYLPVPSGGRGALLAAIIRNRQSKGLPITDKYVEFATHWTTLKCAPKGWTLDDNPLIH